MILHIAGRICSVVLGYFAGVAAGLAAFASMLTLISTLIPGSLLWDLLGLGPVFMLAAPVFFFGSMWIAVVFTFVQAIAANLVTEYFELRQLWLHLVIAMALAVSAGAFLYPQWFSEMSVNKWLITAVALAGALAGGLVHWAIAGRNAGLRAQAPT